MQTEWTQMDKARFVARFCEYWPSSGMKDEANTALRNIWLKAMAPFAVAHALEAIKQIYHEQDFHRMPTVKAVKQNAGAIKAKADFARQKQQERVESKDAITPQQFAECDDYWAPRLAGPDGATYARLRRHLRAGAYPDQVLAREPGEE